MITDHLISLIEDKNAGWNEEAMFQRNNAPAFSSVHTELLFFGNLTLVTERQAKSPYLNVIENAWTGILQNFNQDNCQFDYVQEFNKAIVDAWNRTSHEYTTNLICSSLLVVGILC